MLCEATCDAGEPNQLSETTENLGLWTRLGIPTKATRFQTHHLVRFLFLPYPKTPKTVMQSVMRCGIIYRK